MSKQFTYSLLQFSPNAGLGERLNIGVLFLFADLNRAELRYPKHLQRLRAAFPGTAEKLVRGYLRSIAQRATELSRRPDLWATLDLQRNASVFIGRHLLIPDASAIQFTPVRVALRYATPEQIMADYSGQYLGAYQTEPVSPRQDEAGLARRYKQQLRQIDECLLRRVQEDYRLQVASEEYQFDFAWQNGRQNLVKALSFDFKRADSIQRKAERYFGQLTLLTPTAEERALHFDLLLARPQQRSLFGSYDRALSILAQVPHTELWEGEDIQRYSERTARYLLG